MKTYILYDFDHDSYLGPPAELTPEDVDAMNRGLTWHNYSYRWVEL